MNRATCRVLALCFAAASTSCAGAIHGSSLTPKPNRDAFLVLPGFGYGRASERAMRSLAATAVADGVDVYVPTYLTRRGLASSRDQLDRFLRDNRLDRYERLHVFAFLAGAWTMNPLFERGVPPNLTTVIYDRSPFQERAPAVAVDKLRVFAWLRYGSTIFDVAKTEYPALTAPDVNVGVLVESRPTSFIRHHEQAARAYGPLEFACDQLRQRYEDCGYVPLSHDELYVHFPELWPELRTFIRTGRFTSAMNRTPPDGDPLGRLSR
jgi:hypothetical protein